MHITLSPIRSDEILTISKLGDTLTINGEAFDFTSVPEGASLPSEAVVSDRVTGTVERIAGVLHIQLVLPVPALPYPAPAESRVVTHPEPVFVSEDGPIQLPSWAAVEHEEGAEL